jgi:hypothetical protein
MSCSGCNPKAGDSAIVQAAKTLAHGAVGIVKYVTRTGLAPSAVIAARREACKGCDKNDMGLCEVCKCWIAAKSSLRQEDCPIGKWEKQLVKTQNPN